MHFLGWGFPTWSFQPEDFVCKITFVLYSKLKLQNDFNRPCILYAVIILYVDSLLLLLLLFLFYTGHGMLFLDTIISNIWYMCVYI